MEEKCVVLSRMDLSCVVSAAEVQDDNFDRVEFSSRAARNMKNWRIGRSGI